jgi:small subunit ribosomal protein S1
VRHPNELLKIGQEVQVYVLGINPTEKKIALSIKRTQAEPWSRVENSYEVGQLVRGTVTQLANFGAFARIEDGIEGLIHVSELADERIQHPKQVVNEGQDLILRIIRIDPQRRRMGLSLRRALDTPDEDLIGVFGDGIIEERDALKETLNAALEAEGLLGTRQDEVAEDQAPAAVATNEPVDAEAAIKEAGEAQVAAFEERAARAERANKQRAARSRKKDQDAGEAGSQSFGDDSGMSAMELAFAKLGADLLEEEGTAEGNEEE